MLVIFYIISAVTSLLASVFDEFDKFKYRVTCTVIAILTGIASCVPITKKFASNISDPNFLYIFAVLFLIVWQLAFLFCNWEKIFDYITCAFLSACLICFYCSAFTFSDYLISCNTEHSYTEIVPITNVIEDKSRDVYTYHFTADGVNKSEEVSVSNVQIIYVPEGAYEYLRITSVTDCMGYTRETHRHALTTVTKSYILYIQEEDTT